MEKKLEDLMTKMMSDTPLRFINKPSLEHISVVKIAVTLWNQCDIRVLMIKRFFPLLYYTKRMEEWQKLEDKVLKKVPKLLLPGSLKNKILGLIKPIGLEILKWIEYHNEYCSLSLELPAEFCWKPHGTIEKQKTAEILIKNEKIDVATRYKLSCIYCLEDDILKLWSKIPEDLRKSFYSEESPLYVRPLELVVFWTYEVKGEMAKFDNVVERKLNQRCSPYVYAFEYAAEHGNERATEYFWQKLTSEEKEGSLLKTTSYVANRSFDYHFCFTDCPKKHYTDVLCFLLSQMDKGQQMKVLEMYSYEILEFFVNWPFQNCFMEIAHCLWDFLSITEYYTLLKTFINKVVEGYDDWNYRHLFGEFWEESPDFFKNHTISIYLPMGYLLLDLFVIGDKENISSILKYVPVEVKESILFSSGRIICEHLIHNNRWDLLEFFVKEYEPSKDAMIKFKKEFKNHIKERKIKLERKKWKKFSEVLNDLIYGDDIKSNVSEGSNSPKKSGSIVFKKLFKK